MCVCVCVCVKERGGERDGGRVRGEEKAANVLKQDPNTARIFSWLSTLFPTIKH